MRSTHTYVKMAVTRTVFDEVSNKLIGAGYNHAIHDNGDRGYLLDMHGMALELEPEAPAQHDPMQSRALTTAELHGVMLRNADFWIGYINSGGELGKDDWQRLRDDWEAIKTLLADRSDDISPWQPIATLPDHVPEDDDCILAATDDGRRMIWRIVLLKHQLANTARGRQPAHLQFPATRWMRLPPL